MAGLTDVEIKKRVNDLLYIEKEIVNRLHSDIEEVLRGKGRTNTEIKESINYTLDDRLR